jgi:recombination protein RecR
MLIEEFAKLPGIGSRTAERLTLHLLRVPQDEALGLSDAIRQLREKIMHCTACHNISDTDPCHICSNPQRDSSMICVVEEPKDVMAIENSGAYSGLYHVLMGRYSPLEGLDEQSLTIDGLLLRLKEGGIREVVIATNPNLEGDATATLVGERLAGSGVIVTRIASGVPQGSQIEHVSGAILSDALSGRRQIDKQQG